jgi:hypothetical protein
MMAKLRQEILGRGGVALAMIGASTGGGGDE